MNDRPDLELVVTDWLRAAAPPRAPRELLAAALEQVAGIRQERPLGGRWFDAWVGASPRLHWAIVGALLAAALLGVIAGVGALLRTSPVPPHGVSNGWVAFAEVGSRNESSTSIYMVKTGVAERRVIGSGQDGVLNGCPSFSPDGAKLAYATARPVVVNGIEYPQVDVAVVIVSLDEAGLPTGSVVRLPAVSLNTPVCPRWSPDGQTVAYLAYNASGPRPQPRLWIGHLDGTTTEIAGSTHGLSGFDWSPDGSSVVAVGDEGMTMWAVPLDGGPAKLLRTADTGVVFAEPRWSPDGTRIAVTAEAIANNPDGSSGGIAGTSIEVYRADGSGSPIRLGTGSLATWSPDGRRLALIAPAPGGENEIVTVAPGADDRRVIASDPSMIRALAWSPDGVRLLYVAALIDGPTGGLSSVVAVGNAAPIVLTKQPHYLEYTTSGDISWQPVFP